MMRSPALMGTSAKTPQPSIVLLPKRRYCSLSRPASLSILVEALPMLFTTRRWLALAALPVKRLFTSFVFELTALGRANSLVDGSRRAFEVPFLYRKYQ